jgi:hypothetical protein
MRGLVDERGLRLRRIDPLDDIQQQVHVPRADVAEVGPSTEERLGVVEVVVGRDLGVHVLRDLAQRLLRLAVERLGLRGLRPEDLREASGVALGGRDLAGGVGHQGPQPGLLGRLDLGLGVEDGLVDRGAVRDVDGGLERRLVDDPRCREDLREDVRDRLLALQPVLALHSAEELAQPLLHHGLGNPQLRARVNLLQVGEGRDAEVGVRPVQELERRMAEPLARDLDHRAPGPRLGRGRERPGEGAVPDGVLQRRGPQGRLSGGYPLTGDAGTPRAPGARRSLDHDPQCRGAGCGPQARGRAAGVNGQATAAPEPPRRARSRSRG